MTKNELDKQIIKMWKDDKKYKEIAEKLYCSEAHVSNVITEFKKQVDVAVEAVTIRYFEGMNFSEAIKPLKEVFEK
ncbi:MAG: hypothetical protein FH761_16700 [Firmicutes bacterium]|nr:hypothetical protein [Bacillota bacterium]